MTALGWACIGLAGAFAVAWAVLHAIADRGREDVIWELGERIRELEGRIKGR